MSKLRQVKTSLRSNVEVKLEKKKTIQSRMKQRRAKSARITPSLNLLMLSSYFAESRL